MVVVEGKRYRRRMTKFRIDKISSVDRPAMEPALAVILKRDDGGDLEKVLPKPGEDESQKDFVARFMADEDARAEFGKREQRLAVALETYRSAIEKRLDYDECVTVMTSEAEGHQHLVWLRGERGGTTSTGKGSRDETYGHEHPWTIGADGMLVIGSNDGHVHDVDQAAIMAAMRELLLEETNAPEAVIDVVFAAPDGVAVSIDKMTDEEAVKAIETGSLVCKRTSGEIVAEAAALPDGSFPVRTKSDLLLAIQHVGANEDQCQAARHIVKRARVLGLEDELPDELVEVAKAGDPAGNPEPKDRSGGNPKMSKPTDAGGAGDVQKQLDAATAEIAKLKGELETATKVAGLAPDHLAHYNGLGSDEKKAAFLAKSEGDRRAELDEVQKGDPVEYQALDGTEYRKSAGADTIRLAKQADDLAKRLAASEADRALAVLEKRADVELGAMPGDTKVRAAVLKAIDGIEDEELRKGGQALLKAGNTALAKNSQRLGTQAAPSLGNGNDAAEAEAELTRRANELVEKNADGTLDFYEAYDREAVKDPELAKRAIGAALPATVEG